MSSKWYLGLVHGPVRNKIGQEVTTSVTNLDIHDIARSCRTFGFERYHIITPIKLQQELVGRILGHWESDKGSAYNPDRTEALSDAELSDSIEVAIEKITLAEGRAPLIVVTGANFAEHDGDTKELVQRLKLDDRPMLLLFGTGWGLTASVVSKADFRLAPILGRSHDGYNHLSVRSAVAIYCDRLCRSL